MIVYVHLHEQNTEKCTLLNGTFFRKISPTKFVAAHSSLLANIPKVPKLFTNKKLIIWATSSHVIYRGKENMFDRYVSVKQLFPHK